MVIGVAIGAAIYGYMPTDLLAKVAGRDNPFAVIVVVLIGMPLYIRVEAAIPIGLALIGKGTSIGAVIAFIIIVFVTAVVSGLIFYMLPVSI